MPLSKKKSFVINMEPGKAMHMVTSQMAVAVVAAVFAVITGLLLYQFVWRELTGEVQLPSEIVTAPPALDTKLLDTINTQRLDRIQHVPRPFIISAYVKPGLQRLSEPAPGGVP